VKTPIKSPVSACANIVAADGPNRIDPDILKEGSGDGQIGSREGKSLITRPRNC